MLIKAMKTIAGKRLAMSPWQDAEVPDDLARELIDAGVAIDVAERHPVDIIRNSPLSQEQINRIHKACPDVAPATAANSPLYQVVIPEKKPAKAKD